MEQIYNPIDFKSSEHISVQDYFMNFKKNLEENIPNVFKNESTTNQNKDDFEDAFNLIKINFTEKQKKQLIEVCRFVFLKLVNLLNIL